LRQEIWVAVSWARGGRWPAVPVVDELLLAEPPPQDAAASPAVTRTGTIEIRFESMARSQPRTAPATPKGRRRIS
jgi:hypothetical protein